MYNASVFNQKNLFLRLNNLFEDHIISNKIDLNKPLNFFFRANFIINSLDWMVQLNKACVLQINEVLRDKLTKISKRFVFGSNIVKDYLYQIMPILNTLFILQDKIMPIIATKCSIKFKTPKQEKNELESIYFQRVKSFKKSLNKFPTYAYVNFNILNEFPKEIKKLTNIYWKRSAQITRKYRNIDQHIIDLHTHTYFQIEPNERIVVLLPDNPNAKDDPKKQEKFTYLKMIDVFDFLKNSFFEFHQFVEDMAKYLGYEPKSHNQWSPDSSHLELKDFDDASTILATFFQNQLYEICKGKGFPCKLILKFSIINKRIHIQRIFI